MSEAIKDKSFEELYEELCALPSDVVGEILRGELVVSPRPSPKHASASSGLGGKLFDPFQSGKGGPGGWWILDEPQVHLAEQVVVPDLAGWKKERLPSLPDKNYFDVAPDWVCEVLSPSTARHDRVTKMGLYSQFKISCYWLIDPAAKTLEVLELSESGWFLRASFGERDKVAAPPFDAIEFDLGDLWAD